MVDVSIIIVNYNTSEFLVKAVESVFKNTADIQFEIIIVDNDSVPAQKELLNQLKDQCSLIIFSETNLGFGAANNLGARHAQGKFVMFLNPDTLLLNNAIKLLHDFASNHSTLGAVGADLFDMDLKPAFSFGNFPSLKQQFSEIGFNKFYKSFYLRQLAVAVTNRSTSVLRVDYVSGAAFMMSKDRFDRIGGFDEKYFLYYEETDLCFRLLAAGYSNYLMPEAKIIHLESVSTSTSQADFNFSKYRFMETSKYYFFKKSYGSISAVLCKIFTLTEHTFKYIFLGFNGMFIKKFNITFNA